MPEKYLSAEFMDMFKPEPYVNGENTLTAGADRRRVDRERDSAHASFVCCAPSGVSRAQPVAFVLNRIQQP